MIFGDGDDRALIEKQIADSGIGKNVKLMGNRPLNQIAEAYQQADVFVLPSLRETSGNVLLEAMAYAVPIVAFDTSFCRLLKEVDCGVFVNTEQALDKIKEDYCKAIVTLGQDKELAKQMPGMVIITESSPSMISVISDSTSVICLSSNSICSTDCVTCKDRALSLEPTDFCARILNSLACSLLKCPWEETSSRLYCFF